MTVTELPAPREPVDLRRPDLYVNRELSQVSFNQRVLELARDSSVPLLERLRFLCISSSNLDEFYEVRVAALIQKVEAGSTQMDADNIAPGDLLREVSVATHALVDEQYRVLNDELLPAMHDAGVRFLRRSEWTKAQSKWVKRFFKTELLPVLSPIGLDPAHPFPRILNKSLNFIVRLEGQDAFGRDAGYAIVQAPRSLPRIVRMPRELQGSGPQDFVFLSSIIHAHVNSLFHGMEVEGCYQFRVTRNSNLFVDEEEVDDLLRAVEGELSTRRYGDAVRLEIDDDCPESMIAYLQRRFELQESAIFAVNGPVNLSRLMAVPDLVDQPEHKFPGFAASLPVRLSSSSDLFAEIRNGDILLHHPYESFAPVIDLLRQAARDPKVLAIKQTLYRTGPDSAVVDALVTAARAGKEVTVVVELRARFDEADNIGLAQRLEEAGAHVVYGVVGYKTHAKMLMIVRRETDGLRQYVHLGTGNYHPRTTRLYTDYGFLSCDPALGEDVHMLFLQLTSLGKPSEMQVILDAPFNLYDEMIRMIQHEAEAARAGQPARIIAKMNALVEPGIIRALYTASQAGVQIDLIVRGMCCLRPGLKGISDNIRVRSVLGRFLEHSRVFYFENHGEPRVFLASADWMERNLFNRVEACFPLLSPKLRERVLADLQMLLEDEAQSWMMHSDGRYQRQTAGAAAQGQAVQLRLLESLQGI